MCKQVGVFLLKVCLWTGSGRSLDPTQIQKYSDSDSELLNQNLQFNEICMPIQVWKGKNLEKRTTEGEGELGINHQYWWQHKVSLLPSTLSTNARMIFSKLRTAFLYLQWKVQNPDHGV